jgi:diacylglycerol kinase family enzyme
VGRSYTKLRQETLHLLIRLTKYNSDFKNRLSDCKIQQNALKVFIISLSSTYMFWPAPAILRVHVIKYQVQFFKKSVIKIKKRVKYLVKMS